MKGIKLKRERERKGKFQGKSLAKNRNLAIGRSCVGSKSCSFKMKRNNGVFVSCRECSMREGN